VLIGVFRVGDQFGYVLLMWYGRVSAGCVPASVFAKMVYGPSCRFWVWIGLVIWVGVGVVDTLLTWDCVNVFWSLVWILVVSCDGGLGRLFLTC